MPLFPLSGSGSSAGSVEVQTSDTTLTSDANGNHYVNTGAASLVTITLWAPSAGDQISFYVDDANGISVVPATGTSLWVEGTEAGPDGSTTGYTAGSAIHLVAISSTDWVARSVTGTWTTIIATEPDSIFGADLISWYDADTASTLTKDSGNNLSQWSNRVTGEPDLSQASGSNQPLWVADVANGRPGVLFNGSSDYIYSASAPSDWTSGTPDPGTFWIVFNPNEVADYIFSFSNTAGGEYMGQHGDGTLYQTSAGAGMSPGTPTIGVTSVIRLDMNWGSTGYTRLDEGTPGTTSLGAASSIVLQQISLGNFRNGSSVQYYWGGYILEFFFTRRIATAGEVSQVNTYLNAKYGLALA